MTAITFRRCLIALICLAGVCAGHAREVLYVRLGGNEGIKVIADNLVDRVAADPLTGPSFQGANLNRIKRLLAEQICELAGGRAGIPATR